MRASILKIGIAAICVVGAVGLVSPHDFDAQQLTGATVEIPGMGVLKLSEFPPEIRKYVRIPSIASEEPLEEYGDLAPAPFRSSDVLTENTQPEASSTSRMPPPQAQEVDDAELYRRSAQHRHDREAIMRRLYQERAFPSDRIPEDAYRKAWSHIQQNAGSRAAYRSNTLRRYP